MYQHEMLWIRIDTRYCPCVTSPWSELVTHSHPTIRRTGRIILPGVYMQGNQENIANSPRGYTLL